MVRDPTTTIHAEDLQAGSSYNIPKLTQQTFGKLRAADEIIDEVCVCMSVCVYECGGGGRRGNGRVDGYLYVCISVCGGGGRG
jgi:hypothetical protein